MDSSPAFEAHIARLLARLGIPETFRVTRPLDLCEEAPVLVSVGLDIYGREQRLAPHAAACWQSMQSAARDEGVELLLVSGFRSVDYQHGIWERKLGRGQSIEEILTVSAPPGYSQHHSGLAVDITTPGVPDLAEEFESTLAFQWLLSRAGGFGFTMSYPRNNRYGISYEPWHWYAAHPG